MDFNRFQITVVLSFLALVSICESKLTRLPANGQTLVGASVKIDCFTENKDYPPSWSHIRVGSTQPSDVYLTVKRTGQNTIEGRMTQEYYGRFSVHEDRLTGEYSLLVTNVQLGDAGRYTCTARGGIGQQASAELGVIESDLQCASNATEMIIGENICNQEPDHIEFSCSFRYNGNILPMVNWVKSDRPGQVIRIEEAQRTDNSGVAVSKFVLRADANDLDSSSFTCIIPMSNEAKESSKVSCSTQAVNVLRISNMTESRKVVKPEEVQCNPFPQPSLPETGCKWVKRRLGEDVATETVVSKSRLLNLYRPELHSGIYVCIIECSLRDQPCSVEALTIIYEPSGPSLGESGSTAPSQSTSSSLVIILSIVLSVVLTVAFMVLACMCVKFRSKKSERSAEEPIALTNSSSQSSSSSHEDRKAYKTESIPLTGSDDSTGVDIPDSRRLLGVSGDRELRQRRAEEKAMERMRANALRQSSDEATGDLDVAEGLHNIPQESGKDE